MATPSAEQKSRTAARGWRQVRLRTDHADASPTASLAATFCALLAAGLGFVALGGTTLDLDANEARLGLAASGPVGPFGSVYGGWDVHLPAGEVAASWAWASIIPGWPGNGAVRGPAIIAGLLAGWLLARRLAGMLGISAAMWLGLCWYGSYALIDHSGRMGIDWVGGLCAIAALDRLLTKGSDLVAGAWTALALLAGGWTCAAFVLLALVVIGRPGSWFTWKLLVPPAAAFAAWAAWVLASSQVSHRHVEALASALFLPFKEPSAWWLASDIALLALPFGPLALLAAIPAVRRAWPEPARELVVGWTKIVAAGLIVGTFIPGLAGAVRLPVLAGIAMIAASCATLAASSGAGWSPKARRGLAALVAVPVLIWILEVFDHQLPIVGLIRGTLLTVEQAYYRATSVLLLLVGAAAVLAVLAALWGGMARTSLAALVLTAVGFKIAHAGIYAPEWNYRASQGPWGRAIGQWVPEAWPIYIINEWPHDLGFAIAHPMRRIPAPESLADQPGDPLPKFVLLHPSDFEQWPADAPKIQKVFEFYDQFSHRVVRVLARTPGAPDWHYTGKVAVENLRAGNWARSAE